MVVCNQIVPLTPKTYVDASGAWKTSTLITVTFKSRWLLRALQCDSTLGMNLPLVTEIREGIKVARGKRRGNYYRSADGECLQTMIKIGVRNKSLSLLNNVQTLSSALDEGPGTAAPGNDMMDWFLAQWADRLLASEAPPVRIR